MGIINQIGSALLVGGWRAVNDADTFVFRQLEKIRADKWLPYLTVAGGVSYYAAYFFGLGTNDIINRAMENVYLPSHFVTGGLCYGVFQLTFELTRGVGGNYVAIVSGIAATALFAHLISLPLIAGVGFALLGALCNFNPINPHDDIIKVSAAFSTSIIYVPLSWGFALKAFIVSNLNYDMALRTNAFHWGILACSFICALGVDFAMKKLNFSFKSRDITMLFIIVLSVPCSSVISSVSLIHQIAMLALSLRFAFFMTDHIVAGPPLAPFIPVPPMPPPFGGGGGGVGLGVETMSPV